MKHLTSCLLLICLAGLSPAAPPKGLQREVLQPSVAVLSQGGLGSGTVIMLDMELYVLTAAHVVEDCMKPRMVEYTDEEGNTIEVEDKTPLPVRIVNRLGDAQSTRSTKVVWYDRKNDLALLKVDDPRGLTHAHLMATGHIRAIHLKPQPCSPGEDAWYCGSGGGLFFSLCKTIVNQVSQQWLTVNGIGWYGHSGSGCYVRRGGKFVLVGVLVELDHLNNPRTPLKCVPLNRIQPFLKAYLARQRARARKDAKPDLPVPKEVKP